MGSKIIKIALMCLLPFIGYGQIGYRKADTSLVVTEGGQVLKFKTWDYINNVLNTKTTYVETISQLQLYSGGSQSIIVKDNVRGGLFNYSTETLLIDNGIVFPATGKGSGYWVRSISKEVYPEFWGTNSLDSRSYIQSALNYAAGKALNVSLRNSYTIDSTLVISSSTALIADKNSVISLKDSVHRVMLMNKNAVYLGSSDIVDSNIVVKGGIWRANGLKQNAYSDGVGTVLTVGFGFYGVRHVSVSDLRIDSTRTYGIHFATYKDISISNINIDNGNTIFNRNLDGVHLDGPGINAIIDNSTFRGTDDQVAICADGVPLKYVNPGQGDINNTIVSNIILDDPLKFVRILAAQKNVTNTVINNITGGVIGEILVAGNYGLGVGGMIDNLSINNMNIKVNQSSNEGRSLLRFEEGAYGDVSINNTIVSGNHYNNATTQIKNNSTFNSFKINNFTSVGKDTLSYADFYIGGGTAGNAKIKNLDINGYNFFNQYKKASAKVFEIHGLSSDVLSIKNTTVDTAKYVLDITGATIKKMVLGSNIANNSISGIAIDNTTIDSLYINGTHFKDNNNLAFNKAVTSSINGIYANPTYKNSNSNVTSFTPIYYKSNGTTYSITPPVPTIQQVLASGNNSTLGVSFAQLGVGTTTPSGLFEISGAANVVSNITRSSSDANGGSIAFRKSRNGLVVSGDELGYIDFFGYDGSSYRRAALIYASVDGVAAAGSMPGRLSFFTTPIGSISSLERMRIHNSGNISVGATTDDGVNKLQIAGGVKLSGKLNVGIAADYADNAAALAGGLIAGDVYRTGDLLKVVH